MATAWNGCTVVCDCGSENLEPLPDENHHLEDYERFKCLDCGNIIKIELPN
jgi:hypothetical protein